MKNTFKDKYGPWAVITGGTSGIGEASACYSWNENRFLVFMTTRLTTLRMAIKMGGNVR